MRVSARRAVANLGVMSVLALLLSIVLPAMPSLADTTWSSSVSLTSDASLKETTPQIVASQDGLKIAAVWVRRTGASTGVIQVARSVNGGRSWSPAETVTATPANVENPRIVGSNDLGRLRVFWVQRGVTTGTIRTSASVDAAPWPSATDLTSKLELGDSAAYSVSAAPNGEAVRVVWVENLVGSGYDVVKHKSSFTGLTWSPEETLSPTPGNASRPTVVTTDGGNAATVVWNHVNAPQSRTAQLIRGSTGDWSPVRTLSPNGSGTAFDVNLSLPSAIRGAAIWSQFDADSDRVPYVSVNTAGTWSDAVVLSEENTNSHRIVSAFDGSRIVAVWSSSSGLRARVRSSGTWQSQVTLPGPPGDHISLAASSDARELVAVWRTTSGYALAAASSVDGGQTWTALSSPAGPTVDMPKVEMGLDGTTFAAVWGAKEGASWYPRAAGGPPLVPAASLSPSQVDFGQVPVGETVVKDITISNSGLGVLQAFATSVSGLGFARGSFGGCGLALQPGSSCTVSVAFAPTGSGAQSGSLTITDNAAGSPRTVSLTGTGVSTDVKQAQVPRDRKGIPPKRIRGKGLTVLVGRNALTNADQRIRTRVKVKAKKSTYRIVKGRNGKVAIRTFGKPLKRVTLFQRAPETATHLPYKRKSVYRKGKR